LKVKSNRFVDLTTLPSCMCRMSI